VIYLYIKKEITVDTIRDLFGLETFDELCESYQFPYLEENELNIRANNILQELRDIKNGYYPP